MSNLNNSYTFKPLGDDNQPVNTCAYALCDGEIVNITPADWTNCFDGFKSQLTNCNGNLIIVAKEETSDNLNNALMMYDDWYSTHGKGLKPLENKIEWITLEGNYNKNVECNIENADTQQITMKTAKIKTIIRGGLLVLTGKFPDIAISLGSTTEGQNVSRGTGHPSITVSVLQVLLQYTFKFMVHLEKDIFKNSRRKRVVYINPKFQELYSYSRDEYLYDLSSIFFYASLILNDMMLNKEFTWWNSNIENTVNNLNNNIEKYEKRLDLLSDTLQRMVSTVDDNKAQFSAMVKWAISISVSILLSIGFAGAYYSNHKDDSTNRDLLIAVSIIGGVVIVAIITVYRYVERYKIKRRKFEIAKDA